MCSASRSARRPMAARRRAPPPRRMPIDSGLGEPDVHLEPEGVAASRRRRRWWPFFLEGRFGMGVQVVAPRFQLGKLEQHFGSELHRMASSSGEPADGERIAAVKCAARPAPACPLSAPAYDLVIVGAGINGAGIARDAAGRGLKVLVVEQGDIAGATSSWSTKLVHGGLRYLEHYEFRLVRRIPRRARGPALCRAAPGPAAVVRPAPRAAPAPRLDDPRRLVPLRSPRPSREAARVLRRRSRGHLVGRWPEVALHPRLRLRRRPRWMMPGWWWSNVLARTSSAPTCARARASQAPSAHDRSGSASSRTAQAFARR